MSPNATINCRVYAQKGNSFYHTPRSVMEVLLDFTRNYDRNENKEPIYYLFKTISYHNKDELEIIHFPNVKIEFVELSGINKSFLIFLHADIIFQKKSAKIYTFLLEIFIILHGIYLRLFAVSITQFFLHKPIIKPLSFSDKPIYAL